MDPAVNNIIDPAELTQEIEGAITTLSRMDAKTLLHTFNEWLISILPTLLTATIVLIVGVVLTRLAVSFARKMMKRSKLEPTLHHFSISIIRVTLYLIVGITVMAILVPNAIGGLVAALGVFGLAISLAVKDSLANLAGGLSVLFTKPFALGDYVLIDSIEGTVREIRLNYTVLTTMDNKTIHIPNGDVAKAQITNYTYQTTRRLDLKFSIHYEDDFRRAERAIEQVVGAHPSALKDPEPIIRVIEHADSALIICCRVWVETASYWPLHYDLLEQVKLRFDEEGIRIPYPHVTVTGLPTSQK